MMPLKIGNQMDQSILYKSDYDLYYDLSDIYSIHKYEGLRFNDEKWISVYYYFVEKRQAEPDQAPRNKCNHFEKKFWIFLLKTIGKWILIQ